MRLRRSRRGRGELLHPEVDGFPRREDPLDEVNGSSTARGASRHRLARPHAGGRRCGDPGALSAHRRGGVRRGGGGGGGGRGGGPGGGGRGGGGAPRAAI